MLAIRRYVLEYLLKDRYGRFLSYEPPSPIEIKAIRKQYNLSQRCFAEMLNINYRTLQAYELGRTRPSQAATALFNLAKIEKTVFTKYIGNNFRPFVK